MVKMFLFRWFYSVPAALSSCFYSLLDALGLRQTEAKIWFVGFDHAAKITLLQKLIDEKLIDEQIIQRQLNQDAIPMELSTRKIIFRTNVWGIPQIAGKIKFKAFDVGSLQNARMFLQEYYAKVDVIVYLGDATDQERLENSMEELRALMDLAMQECRNASGLIFFDRDDPFAFSDIDFSRFFEYRRFSIGVDRDNILIYAFLCSVEHKMRYNAFIRAQNAI